jgi:hypothetical protein
MFVNPGLTNILGVYGIALIILVNWQKIGIALANSSKKDRVR